MAEARVKRVRTCIGCGIQSDKVDLLRIVRSPEGAVSFDKTGRAPGRGAYVCSAACLDEALKKRKLQRALKCGIKEDVTSKLVEQLAASLEEGSR